MESPLEQLSLIFNQVSSGFFDVLQISQVVGYILTVLFLAGIIVCASALSNIKEEQEKVFENHVVSQGKKTVDNSRMKHWKEITTAIMSDQNQLWRLAIIDADTLLEDMIRGLGYTGQSFGEVLKTVPQSTPWIDAAWKVHYLRNTLAHEGSRYTLTHREAYQAYKIYEGILYETGYLS